MQKAKTSIQLNSFLFIFNDCFVWRANFRQIDGVAPTFIKKPAIRQEDDGKRLLFECRIKADPKPSVSWSHNAVQVKESSRHKVCFRSFSF